MLQLGMAWAFVRYSRELRAARGARKGREPWRAHACVSARVGVEAEPQMTLGVLDPTENPIHRVVDCEIG
jgi:hypothetical protein